MGFLHRMKMRLTATSALAALVWLGPVLLLTGLSSGSFWSQWHPGRALELLVISLVALGLSRVLARWTKASLATALVLCWLALLMVFAGPLAVLATGLVALGAIALGTVVCPQASLAAQGLAGAIVLAGVIGWLLPFPIHHAEVYLPGLAGLVAWRRRALAVALAEAKSGWHAAVVASPRLAVFALVALGLASTACWLPTVQFDDLAYHLGLVWQLQEDAAFRPDPRLQVWALAPWSTDVLHALPQVIQGQEARGPVNAAWLAVTAVGIWHLCRRFGASASVGWLSVGLFASLPLTAALAGGMQTELPTAAALVWLAVLVSRPVQGGLGFWMQVAILTAGLVAMKTIAAAMAAVFLLWALVRHRWPRPTGIAAVIGIGAVLASSSYVNAYLATGNPVLPLFNSLFRSRFFPADQVVDERWHAGFNALLPWDMTFHSSRYGELFDGGGGFVLVALAGAWLVSLAHRDLRPLALAALAVLVVPLVPLQYLRYAYPAMVLVIPIAVVAGARAAPSRLLWLGIGLCLLNLAFQSSSHWTLRTGIVKQTVLALGQDAPVFADYAPERILVARIRAASTGGRNVMFLSPNNPYFAELGRHGRSIAWYSPSLQASAAAANRDESGSAWVALLSQERIGDVILRPADTTPAQRRALEQLGAQLRESVGEAQWWSLPE